MRANKLTVFLRDYVSCGIKGQFYDEYQLLKSILLWGWATMTASFSPVFFMRPRRAISPQSDVHV